MSADITPKAQEALTQWRNAVGRPQLRELAVMVTDMAGSTAFLSKHGARALLDKTERHHALVLPILEDHRGTVLRIMGDATQSIFDDSADAARCAIALQRWLATHNATDPEVELK